MMIVFLGRSVDGILTDARREFPKETGILVVCRENDTLPPPAGLVAIPVTKFQPEPGMSYTVVCNGGTTTQLVPVLKRLVEAGVPMQAYDLQRDGKTRLW